MKLPISLKYRIPSRQTSAEDRLSTTHCARPPVATSQRHYKVMVIVQMSKSGQEELSDLPKVTLKKRGQLSWNGKETSSSPCAPTGGPSSKLARMQSNPFVPTVLLE